MACVFCSEEGGEVLWQNDWLRVVLVSGPAEVDYPGFCRVIWNAHVAEFSDLDIDARQYLMLAVHAVERALRQVMQPNKINLASLGNQAPHLHWHVIPRFTNDAHFPLPVWAPRQRTVSETLLGTRRAQSTLLRETVRHEIERALA